MSTTKVVWLNHQKCTGCRLCTMVCSFTKTSRFNPDSSRVKILERDEQGSQQMICRNCAEAPCLDACPAGALTRRRGDNYVVLNEERCVGCNMCVMVCPFNAIGQGNHRNYKCDTCNGEERCARICEHGAIGFLDASKVLRKKRQHAAALMSGGAGREKR